MASEASEMWAGVLAGLEARGHRAAFVRAGRLDEIRRHYEKLAASGVLDAELAQGLLKGLSLRLPGGIPDEGTLVVLATPDPVVCCVFEWRGAKVEVPVPPTYLHLRRDCDRVAGELAGLLPRGSHVTGLVNGPHKLLAVRGGLARYGRNNITYVPGLGSLCRLTTVCTSVPCESAEWLAPSMMPRCETCSICVAACPTGAIREDRFVISGERCITQWNERPGDVPFPEWLADDWHNCLVGCLRCQLACPENADVMDLREAGPSFTEDETEILLRARDQATLPEALSRKLRESDLLEWVSAMTRNLAALLPGDTNRAA